MKTIFTEVEKREIAEKLKGKLFLNGHPALAQGFRLPFADVYATRPVDHRFFAATFSWECLNRAIVEGRLPLYLETN